MNTFEIGMLDVMELSDSARTLRDCELEAVYGGQACSCPPPQPNDAAMSVWNRLLFRYGFPYDSDMI
jgi:hypothetical protein